MSFFLNTVALRRDFERFRQRLLNLQSSQNLNLISAFAEEIQLESDAQYFPVLQELLRDQGQFPGADVVREEIRLSRERILARQMEVDLEHRAKNPGITVTLSMVDQMDPYKFQDLIGMIYSSKGFVVERPPNSGDQGADLIVRRGPERIAVQIKRWSENVGNGAIQEVVAAKRYWRCQHSAVIITSSFTASAVELGSRNDVELIDRPSLERMLIEFNRKPKDYEMLTRLFAGKTPPLNDPSTTFDDLSDSGNDPSVR